MPDDPRDKRKPITPPPGVLAQIAPPGPTETWDNDKSGAFAPLPVVGRAPSTDLDVIDKRTRKPANASVTTLNLVENLRRETKNDISNLNEKVDEVIDVLGDLRGEVGELKGISASVDTLTTLIENRDRVDTETTISEVKVRESRALTQNEIEKRAQTDILDHQRDARALRLAFAKDLGFKILRGIGIVAAAMWAVIGAVYLSKCGG